MMAKTAHTEQSGRVLTVRLDNPPRNFMTSRMVDELYDLVRRLDDDPSVGAVVLTGVPEGIFITHFDVEEILQGSAGVGATLSSRQAGGGLRVVGAAERVPAARSLLERTPAAGALALRRIHDVFLRMNRLDKAFIAAINGTALGGGCELALACDVRIMAEGDGRIGLPEATLGLIPGAGGTQRMTRALGTSRALEMMLEGRALTPEEAREVGLVHRTVPAEALMREAHETAERLARRSPATVGGLKRAVYEGSSRPLEEGMHIERAGFLAAASTPAAQRGMKAYVEQVRGLGEVNPSQIPELLTGWQAGIEVDLSTQA